MAYDVDHIGEEIKKKVKDGQKEDVYIKAIAEGIKNGTDNAVAKALKVKKPTVVVHDGTESMLSRYRFITLEETDELRYWKDGVYQSGGEIIVAKELEAEWGYELNSHNLSQVIGHIKRRTYHKQQELDADINIINMKNGLYDIKDGELKPHTPTYLSVKQIPVTYKKEVMPKLFFTFLKQILYKSNIRTVIELFGYTFYRDNPFEVITTLLGGGANGKNVILGLLAALHGVDNVSNVSMKSIIEEQFALADLEGKNVNIDTELSSVTIKDTAILKKLTGRQRTRVERKNQQPYETKLYAKLFFNANQIPLTYDDSDAYFRRNILIQLPNQFVEESDDPTAKIADPYLLDKLTTDDELSGVFNVCIGALRGILKRGKIYVSDRSIKERREKYRLAIDPVAEFLKIAIDNESVESDKVTKEKVYQAFRRFCNSKHLMVISKEKLGSILKNTYHIKEDRLGTGRRETIWVGVRLTPEYSLELAQATLTP